MLLEMRFYACLYFVNHFSFFLCVFRIWNLADINKDGSLDLYEYSIARHFIDMKLQGFELPRSLPDELLTPSRFNGPHNTAGEGHNHMAKAFNSAYYSGAMMNTAGPFRSDSGPGTPGRLQEHTGVRIPTNINEPFELFDHPQRSQSGESPPYEEGLFAPRRTYSENVQRVNQLIGGDDQRFTEEAPFNPNCGFIHTDESRKNVLVVDNS